MVNEEAEKAKEAPRKLTAKGAGRKGPQVNAGTKEEAKKVEAEAVPNAGKKHILVRHRTIEEIFEDINKDKKPGEKKAARSEMPKLILRLLALFALVALVSSVIAALAEQGNNYLYGFTLVLWSLLSYIIIVAYVIDPVPRPEEWIISFVGEFSDIATPGPYPYRIPRLTKVVSRVKVDTSQPLELFREEKEKPVIFADGVTAKPKALVIINIKDPYAVTYKVSVHDHFVKERQAIGIVYSPSHIYFYAIEEILDSLIRGFFGGMGIEQVLQLKTSEYAGVQKAIESAGKQLEVKPNIVKEIEIAADIALAPYGVDVESLAFPEIVILEEDIVEKLQEKFKAKQDKEIQELQVKVEEQIVKVEEQKALQEEQKGVGAGKFLSKQIDAVKDTGVPAIIAANVITTRMWTDAARGGANVNIISTAEDGKVRMPIITGVGMGLGQEFSARKNKSETKKPTRAEVAISEKEKPAEKTPKGAGKKEITKERRGGDK